MTAGGRFNVYICDRFIVPAALTPCPSSARSARASCP